MRTYITSLLLMLVCSASAQSIEFPLDTNAVTIDGVMSASEWDAAETIQINVNTTDKVGVKFKHDNTAMYFAFYGKLESANALFPEVLIDPQNIGGNSWSVGQWWFHVSATDCENDTTYGSYSNCMTVQPDWEGAPNFSAGAPMTDTVEIRIPFSKVGFNTMTMDTMGMVLMVTNTLSAFHTYPSSADKDVPSTWMKATFSKYHVHIADLEGPELKLYPNPVKNKLHLDGVKRGQVMTISDLRGRVVLSKVVTGDKEQLDVAQLAPGTYALKVEEGRDRISESLFSKY